LVRLLRAKNYVGLAELPSGSELGGLGEIAGVSFGQAFVGPGLKKRNLLVRKTKFAGEFQVGGSGKPRRHDASTCDNGDLGRKFGSVLIIEQGKWRGFAGTVTG
jgi:hypothetical protein